MDWIQFLMLFISITGMFVSSRAEARAAAKEMKDFHGRLCALEERYIQMMQRILEGK